MVLCRFLEVLPSIYWAFNQAPNILRQSGLSWKETHFSRMLDGVFINLPGTYSLNDIKVFSLR